MRALGLLTLLVLFPALPSPAQPPAPPTIAADDRAAIVEEVIEALEETYIFADVAAKMADHVRGRLAAGDYDQADNLAVFSDQLTEDLRAISKDRHLGVRWDPNPPPAQPDPEDAARRRAEAEAAMAADNYCFRKVERLTGNVGYIKLDCFAPAEFGGETAVAAMGFLAHVDALIFDLRENGGGSPSMIQLITSYLVDEPTHLNSFYIRASDETEQFWTLPHVPGERRPDVPVWVLTSSYTFSGAEEFSYNLRNLERATLVGETTGGGAHPVRGHRIEGYPVRMSLPFGRAVNPISGTNWEGTGVEPHVPVAAADALDVAYTQALDAVLEGTEDPTLKRQLAFTIETLKLRNEAVELSSEELQAYAGTFGPRTIRLKDGALFYRRGEGPERKLVAGGDDRFALEGTDNFRLRFERDDAGKVVRLVGLYVDGREEPSERSGG
jgi:hypothetical protein